MLPYYSPLKIAEQFRMLEALFPGRVDLGVGRAPGGDRLTAQAMSGGAYDNAEQFPQQIYEVVGYLDGNLPEEHAFANVHVQPKSDHRPEVWILGSSDYGGALAAHLGLRFTFAHFINAQGGDAVARAYRKDFRASLRESAPHAMVCVMASVPGGGTNTSSAALMACPCGAVSGSFPKTNFLERITRVIKLTTGPIHATASWVICCFLGVAPTRWPVLRSCIMSEP